jgi:hypothetical protein
LDEGAEASSPATVILYVPAGSGPKSKVCIDRGTCMRRSTATCPVAWLVTLMRAGISRSNDSSTALLAGEAERERLIRKVDVITGAGQPGCRLRPEILDPHLIQRAEHSVEVSQHRFHVLQARVQFGREGPLVLGPRARPDNAGTVPSPPSSLVPRRISMLTAPSARHHDRLLRWLTRSHDWRVHQRDARTERRVPVGPGRRFQLLLEVNQSPIPLHLPTGKLRLVRRDGLTVWQVDASVERHELVHRPERTQGIGEVYRKRPEILSKNR